MWGAVCCSSWELSSSHQRRADRVEVRADAIHAEHERQAADLERLRSELATVRAAEENRKR
jgi:3-dehydroquinate dehydratase